jgi:putative pyrimidine permease RutG
MSGLLAACNAFLQEHRRGGQLPVLGGLSIVVFGLIAATGGRIWVENRVDFSRARNLVTAAVTLTVGAGDLALRFGGFTLGGIGTATFGAILLYQLFRDDSEGTDPGASL